MSKNSPDRHWLARWTNPLGFAKKRLRRNDFSAKTVGRWLLIGFLAFVAMTATVFAYYSRDLPTPGKLSRRQVAQSTQILDRNGKLLYEIHGDQNRTIIPLDQIPKVAQQATLAAEDANFYNEHGFNLRGILRAAFVDVFTGTRSQGGSTITQQFVKNALLTPEKSITRKIKELILSIEIEQLYTKDQILAFYLNEIPYGSNAYGIQAAANTFFNKDAKDLTLTESATLAAMLNAPTRLSPYGSHQDELFARQHYVLDRMADLGMVSKEESEKAKTEELKFAERNQGIKAPHFVLYVKELLTEKYGEEYVEEGGLKVTTTLDLDLQDKAEKAVNDNEARYTARGASNAALVAMDPKTGQILAMVGSHDYFDTEHDGMVNVALSPRQPGSSFKPIVYATAFKDKYNPAYTLWDVPTDFGNYTPQNFHGDFHGPVSMRFALQNSLNIPAVKALALVGLPNALKTAHDLGITTLNDPDRYGLALVLGGGEVKLVDMVSAYSTFANKGVTRDQAVVLKVQDSNGKVLEEFDDNRGKRQSLDPQVAYEMSNVLSDNNARSTVFGSRSPLFFGDRPVAAKTGTTQEFRDAWTIGYTPSLAVGVWVGNNDNHPMKNGADGVVVAAPIFHSFMVSALGKNPAEKFERPKEIKDVTVDRLSNLLPTENSPETVTDIFTSWQAPKDKDNIHVKVNVNKLNGLLATAFTPAELVEERLFTNVHSEMPKNPNWENPVIDWAKNHGIDISNPPTQQDTLYTESTQPVVQITSPTNNQTVSGSFAVQVSIGGTIGVSKVEAFVDGQSLGAKTSSPYTFTGNATGLAIGNHELKVVATDVNQATESSSITIVVGADTTGPGKVQSLSVTTASGSISASWQNPSDADVAKTHVYLSTIPNNLGSLAAQVAATPNSTASATLAGLSNGTTYYVTVKAVDTNGNEGTGTTVTAVPH